MFFCKKLIPFFQKEETKRIAMTIIVQHICQEEIDRKQELQEYEAMFQAHLTLKPMIMLRDNYTHFDSLFQHFDLYTTRFNSFTYQQNKRYKESILDGFAGSLYSTMMPLPVSAPLDKFIFVIDMNNTLNRIMGFGFIKNILAKDQSMQVYDDPGFNNFVYKSKFYLDVNEDTMEPEWMTFIHDEFERTLFYGKSNLKRGGSFTRFPMKRLKYKHLKFLLSLFIIRNPSDFNQTVKL